MDVVQLNHNWNCIEDESAEQSLSPEAPGISDIFRDPELLPRVGDEYQVEIPPLITKSAYCLLTESLTDATILPGISHDFLVGLPISLMWINEVVENIKADPQDSPGDLTDMSSRNESVKSESIREMKIFPEGDLKAKVEPTDFTIYNQIEVGEPAKLRFQQEIDTEMHQKHGGKGYCLVPGSLGDTWSDIEGASFVLGLYIFGKNLVQVKKFVETKRMGDILSFYYGKFYRSDRYRKWSECRKIRSRRCVYGQRIFTGSRQQELLSRLLPHVSEEFQNTFLEVAKMFGEGKMLLEEYVFTLKATVGLNALVDAVGIGQGKQDLTGIAVEPLKSSQVAPVRSEIPIGKACSSLTPLEIINYLTGGYRLSKARSNDLFWEAVWPRLLARGWHSEQPNDHGFAAASRHSLVFLIPGIKRFSRRKLVKGNHYFDSVSDVLNKVASNPALLELDIGADMGCDNKEENGWTNDRNSDHGDLPDKQRHCYLKPRTPSRSSDVMKFTVVDTTLVCGGTTKVRELRSLPDELMNISTSRTDSEESNGDSSEEQTGESDSADKLCFDRKSILKSTKINSDKGVSFDREDIENNFLNKSFPMNGSGFIKVPVNIPEDEKDIKCNGMQPRKTTKGHGLQRMKPRDRKVLGPVAKRQRLIACGRTETSSGTIDVLVSPGIEQDETGCTAGNPDFREDILSRADPPHEKLSSTSSSSRDSPNIVDECTYGCDSSGGAEHLHEKIQSRTLIDLNIPIPQDVETESLAMKMTERREDQTSRPIRDSASEQPLNMNSRRHSTRNRPPTTKALEALACGFLSIKQKRKSRDDFPLERSISRSSRRACSRVRINEDFSTGAVDFEGGEKGNDGCKSNGDMLSGLQV